MKTKLTAAQAKQVTATIEFSVHAPMAAIIKAFPSVTFKCGYSNGGVTYEWELTGPVIWIDKIERRYAY